MERRKMVVDGIHWDEVTMGMMDRDMTNMGMIDMVKVDMDMIDMSIIDMGTIYVHGTRKRRRYIDHSLGHGTARAQAQ